MSNISSILYTDYCIRNWKSVLYKNNIQFVISPLHDSDLGINYEKVRSHYHILFYYNNNKSYYNIVNCINEINASYPIPISNVKMIIRYFCYLDDPEKYQYSLNDIEIHNLPNIKLYINLLLYLEKGGEL